MTLSHVARRWWVVLAVVAVLVLAGTGLLIAQPWTTDAAAPRPDQTTVSTPDPLGPTSTASPTPLMSAGGTPATPAPATPAPDPGASEDPGASDSPIAPELTPVAPTQPAVGEDATTVSLALIEAVEGEAVAPGETSGPAIRVTVRIENTSAEPLDTAYVAVNAYVGADRAPAPGLNHPGGTPFEGAIEPGGSAEGVYLFTVSEESRSDVLIGVDYRPGQPTITFRGALD